MNETGHVKHFTCCYWNEGPQQAIYLPGCWLKKGVNEIIVFEQLNDHIEPVISTVAEPVLTKLKEQTSVAGVPLVTGI